MPRGGRLGKRILLIQGHPDAGRKHLCHALEDAYRQGAEDAGHEVRSIGVAAIDFPVLRSQQEWEDGALPASLAESQQSIRWAGHLVLFFPLWLGDMPALLKAYLEQVARPGFAFLPGEGNPLAHKGLAGRSARVVVTMGMPAKVYRWYFCAHSVKSLERNILGFVGIAPVHETLIGMVGDMAPAVAGKWLRTLAELGRRGD
jgi:putative NADPH-quinone reductase